ncbi:MAG: hypothetical protein WBB38_13610, partial [Hyphomicrobiaceae bacterium]
MTESNKKNWLLDLLMLPAGIVAFFPFYLIIINTFKTMQETAKNPIALPSKWIFTNYIEVFEGTAVLRSFGNTLTVTLFS